ncbi:50S ribosomal protein L24 [Planctomicrobium piriforme]|uniref:Large ribosomal subunit protein uL24 n=1 Tax=Planctomicrobium piriforme TaxID=1576369 RepID=A0A1I3C735_9PLAN|nr:50S ribosomal protein L24 [Planctomicrobium piriforme]SFH70368.1 large subunit ribosomal protein L24 [Planctomicrobium piriforme]
MKIKRGDMVVVIAGDDKGDTPRVVQQVLAGGEKVVVDGVNLVYKHVKRGHPKSPQGGRLRMEKPIQSSNVMYYCSGCGRGVLLGLRFTADGGKERFCRKCKTTIGTVSPARKAHVGKK